MVVDSEIPSKQFSADWTGCTTPKRGAANGHPDAGYGRRTRIIATVCKGSE